MDCNLLIATKCDGCKNLCGVKSRRKNKQKQNDHGSQTHQGTQHTDERLRMGEGGEEDGGKKTPQKKKKNKIRNAELGTRQH